MIRKVVTVCGGYWSPRASDKDVSGHLIALAFCGRIEDAISLATERDKLQAYETLVALGRIEEAVAALGERLVG